MLSFVVHDEDNCKKIYGHEHHDDMSFMIDLTKNSCQKLSHDISCGDDHLEGSVESASFQIRNIGLGSGDPYVKGGDAHDSDDKEAQHHQWYREVQIKSFQKSDGRIDHEGNNEFLIYWILVFVMDESSSQSS